MIINIDGYSVIIDNEDYEKVMLHSWHLQNKPKDLSCGLYYFRTDKKLTDPISMAKHPTLHRCIVGCTKGDGIKVDHINGNTLDNRKCNLRKCTSGDNSHNMKMMHHNKAGYKGVCQTSADSERWQASICVKHKRIYIGTYSLKEEAAEAYDKAALYYFGEFARTNFPKDNYCKEEIGELIKIMQDHRPINNTSGYIGVCFNKKNNKWVAAIRKNNKRIYLGEFPTNEEAARARDKKAIELFGDMAKLNFPKEDYIKEQKNGQETAK